MKSIQRHPRTRTSKGDKTLLFDFRCEANLTQQEIAVALGIDRELVGDYETGRRSLLGEGLLIIRWADACRVDPFSDRVQGILYDTGNAPVFLEPDKPEVRAAYLAFVVELSHQDMAACPPAPGSVRDQLAVDLELRNHRARMPRCHPYTMYLSTRSNDE